MFLARSFLVLLVVIVQCQLIASGRYCDLSHGFDLDFEPFEEANFTGPFCDTTLYNQTCSSPSFENGTLCLSNLSLWQTNGKTDDILGLLQESFVFCGPYNRERLHEDLFRGDMCWNGAVEFCQYINQSQAADCLASRDYGLFMSVIDRYDCRPDYNDYSNLWSCDDCRKSYKDLMCTWHLSSLCGDLRKAFPCISLCHDVAARCPALQPEDSYGGQTLFNCPNKGGDGHYGLFAEESHCFEAVLQSGGIGGLVLPSSTFAAVDAEVVFTSQLNSTSLLMDARSSGIVGTSEALTAAATNSIASTLQAVEHSSLNSTALSAADIIQSPTSSPATATSTLSTVTAGSSVN